MRLLCPKLSGEPNKNKLSFIVAIIGVVLLVSSVDVNMLTLTSLIGKDTVVFKVEGAVGFSFQRLAPAIAQQYLLSVQILGFVLVGLILLWTNKEIFSLSSSIS